MKKNISLVCLSFIFSLSAFAQDSTFIKITFPQSEDWSENKLTLNYAHPSFMRAIYVAFEKDTTANENTFIAKFNNSELDNEVRQHIIEKDEERLFQIIVFPSDSMELLVAENGEVTFLKGKTSKENQLTYNYWFDNFDDLNSFAKYDWEEFFDKLDSLENALISSYEIGMKGQKPNEIYDLYFRTSVKTAIFHTILTYKYLRPAYLGNDDYLKIPKEYESKVPVIDIITRNDYPYINLYLSHISYFFDRTNCPNTTSFYPSNKCKYDFLQTLPKCRLRKLMNLFILNSISINSELESEQEKEIVKNILAELEADYSNDKDFLDIKQLIQKNEKLKSGQPAPNFALQNEEEELITLSSLKGKYVLIHFWATWHQPDVEAIPQFLELEKIFQDKVEFLHLCLGNDKETWNILQAQDSSKGTHVFLNDIQIKIIKIMYDIRHYPNYFLIDKEGKIVTKEVYSPKEAQEKLEKIFEEE
ncbi:thiol-disulfide isomerase-like thioredoxin [Bernardetia litoralis DSM 6794]|uniref:Thiol-disulfide isomerase-like thioredoxin n=1 Tax=Bernardetia litoralis (strain ATCC 23117 / DSM 6794 / NBRC 15988 / NCIMB 1366 / Fx l1 / Sio-4) TaxID=880071 RepID=I4ALM4_BERLS|nr:redoxin family protein [Bernardetia litoralis]AFM04859.1 thiol-disulfide isomerase-like thioredoxin [Bernardetia litoralis DSM 6794]